MTSLTRVQAHAAALGLQADEFKGTFRLYVPAVEFIVISPRLQAVVDELRVRTIRVLTSAGHTAGKALEIAIDAERGNRYTLLWIQGIRALNGDTVL